MESETSWTGEARCSKLYFPSVTPRTTNIFVNYIFINDYRMPIYYFWILFALFYLTLYHVVRTGGMVG